MSLPGERHLRWVVVDGADGTLVPVEPPDTEEVPRSLWMNAAMVALLLRGGLLLHAAGAVLASHGLLLLGRSGVGKSTLSRWVEGAYPDSVLCDERIALRPAGRAAWTMAGTPWGSSADIARRRIASLSALVFLEQAPVNELRPLTAAQAFERSLPLVSIPWQEAELASLGTATLDRLLATVPAYLYRVVNAPSAAKCLQAWALTLPAPVHAATTPLHPDGDATCN